MRYSITSCEHILQTTRLHASCRDHHHHRHDRNVNFMLFHNVTCHTIFLLSRIHVNSTHLVNITSTLTTTRVIWGRLECTYYLGILKQVIVTLQATTILSKTDHLSKSRKSVQNLSQCSIHRGAIPSINSRILSMSWSVIIMTIDHLQ